MQGSFLSAELRDFLIIFKEFSFNLTLWGNIFYELYWLLSSNWILISLINWPDVKDSLLQILVSLSYPWHCKKYNSFHAVGCCTWSFASVFLPPSLVYIQCTYSPSSGPSEFTNILQFPLPQCEGSLTEFTSHLLSIYIIVTYLPPSGRSDLTDFWDFLCHRARGPLLTSPSSLVASINRFSKLKWDISMAEFCSHLK